jgi:phosphoribosylanthranilate isomerase
MKKLQLKICGMRDPANILEVAGLKPDYMGFIYHDKSPRYVGIDFQAPTISKKTKRVGVFVNQSLSLIFREVERNMLSAVQLHGDETPELCSSIKSKGIEVIKVFSVDQDFDFANTKPYQYAADYFLFDTKGINYGGTGKSFDWTLLKNYSGPIPFFLSGGLSVENIIELNKIENPAFYGLDLNSKVEDAPGIKNVQQIKTIIETLKSL